MPRLYRRGGVYWADYTTVERKRVRHSLRTHDRTVAKIILNHLENQHALAAFGVVDEDDLQRVQKRRTPLDSGNLGGKDSAVEAFIKSAGLKTCGEFGRDTIAATLKCWLMEQRESLALETVNKKLWSVQRFGEWLKDNNYIGANATMKVSPLKGRPEPRRKPHRAFTPAEADSLCAGPMGLFYRFRLWTGLRGSEAAQIERGDLDLGDSPTLHVRDAVAKNGHECTIPLARGLAEALRPLAFTTGRIFPDVKLDRAKRNRVTIEHVKAVGAGLNGRSFRMSFVTWLEAAGVELGVRMKLRRDRGSESVKLTNVTYSDPRQVMAILRGGLDSLEKWYAGRLTAEKAAQT